MSCQGFITTLTYNRNMTKYIFNRLGYEKREKLYDYVKKDTDILKRMSKEITNLANDLSVEYDEDVDVMKHELASVLSEHIEYMY